MGSNHHHATGQAVPVDPQAVTEAEKMWAGFTGMIKYGLAAVLVILVLMAFFLV